MTGKPSEQRVMPIMLLIYPPMARSTEPPLGIARLAAFLKGAGREAQCIDLCREGIDYLLGLGAEAEDNRGRLSLRRRARAAGSLCEPDLYRNPSRYARAVDDIGRALRLASKPWGVEASPADYRDGSRSPLRRADLLDAAASFERNVFFPLFERRIAPALDAGGDAWVGISICYLSQALCAFALAGYIKSIRPRTRIVLGGGLVTSWIACGTIDPRDAFGGLVDAAVAGPGEGALAALLNLEETRLEDPLDLEGFSSLSYFAPARIVPYNFSSGCPWKRCSFCPEKAEDMTYLGLPVKEAIARIARLGEQYAPGLYHFTDSEIAPLYLDALAASPPPAPWYGFARFSRKLLDPGFCRALASSGCAMLQLGLESGDQRVLDRLGKGTRIDEIAAILDNLAEAGIGTYVYVLFGTPAEDRDAAMITRDFLALRADRIGFLNVALFNLPATGEEAKELDTRSFFEGDLSLYREFRHPSGWDRPAVRRFLAEDFESVPELRSILRRTPPVFSSNHAPFFLRGILASSAQPIVEP
jgi:hypothetical protein